jgi:hypothetical protein
MMRWLLPLLLLLPLSACQTAAPTCTAHTDCAEGQICSDSGACVTQACASSLDCAIESWCDPGTGQCTPGCLNDRDCLPTEACDQEQRLCVATGCRSTALDCNFGEFCDVLSADCIPAGGFYCHPCESNDDCGSPNNVCVRLGGSNQTTWCGVDCSGGQTCPQGYTCGRVRTTGDVTVSYQCFAPCWEYQ